MWVLARAHYIPAGAMRNPKPPGPGASLPLVAGDLRQLLHVEEVGGRLRRWRAGRRLVGGVQLGWLDGACVALRQLAHVAAHAVHVHVEDARLLEEEVVVDRRHLDAVLL